MGKLTTKERKALPKSDFGLPGKKGKDGENKAGRGAYLLNNPSHDRAAVRDAARAERVGNITKAQEKEIDRKAHRKDPGMKMAAPGASAHPGETRHKRAERLDRWAKGA